MKIRPENLTKDLVLTVLKYEPSTGHFFWITDFRGLNGQKAGYCAQGYNRLSVFGFKYKACRIAHLIVTGNWPEFTVHHKNKITTDDRWKNIKYDVTMKDQAKDRRGWAKRKVDLPKHVYLNQCGNYCVRFRDGSKTLFCKVASNLEEAKRMADREGKRLYGDWYCSERKPVVDSLSENKI